MKLRFSERATKFEKSSLSLVFDVYLVISKTFGTFIQILCPSQNTLTISPTKIINKDIQFSAVFNVPKRFEFVDNFVRRDEKSYDAFLINLRHDNSSLNQIFKFRWKNVFF